MSLSRSLRAYARDTDIFGVHLFCTKRRAFDVIFWGFYVAIFTCYTMRCVGNICANYLSDKTITIVKQKRTDTLMFFAPQFCFIGTPLPDVTVDIDIELVLDQYNKTGGLNISSFLSGISFVHQLVLSELLMLPHSKKHGLAENFNSSKLKGILNTFPNNPPRVLSNFSDTLLLKFCRDLSVNIAFVNGSANGESKGGIAVCERDKIAFASWNNPNAICLDLDGSRFAFQDPQLDSLVIEVNETVIGTKLGLAIDSVWFDLDSRYYFIEGDDADVDSLFSLIPNRVLERDVRVSAIYENLNIRRRPCDPDPVRSRRCDGECKARYFFDSFGCVPTFYMSKPNDNLSQFRRCEAINYRLFVDFISEENGTARLHDCRSGCLAACSKAVFVADMTESSMPGEMTVGNIYVNSHTYTSIEERLASTFEDLLSAIGGTLLIWLGASFASLAHIPVFILQAIAGLCHEKENEKVIPNPLDERRRVLREKHIMIEKEFDERRAMAIARLKTVENILRQSPK